MRNPIDPVASPSPGYQEYRPARVILWGLGATGKTVLLQSLEVEHIDIVGVVDWDPQLAERDLGDVLPEAGSSSIMISPSLERCVENLIEPADVVYHLTESEMSVIQPQLELALSHKLNVISAAETMFYPGLLYPEASTSLDRTAKANGVSITGCGINPGFVFDTLVVALARATTAITGVEIRRVSDASGGGPGDYKHVGFGLWPEEFEEKISTGEIVGHMGMPESIAAVAERLGLPLDRIEETWEAKTSSYPIESCDRSVSHDWPLGTLEPGRVTGIIQGGSGFIGDREAIKVQLIMYHDPEEHGYEQSEEITIEGVHRVHATIAPSLSAHYGMGPTMMNATLDVLEAAPGLHNLLDFRTGGGYRGGFRLTMDPGRQPEPGSVWLVQEPITHSR